jgi:hypothetical protein
MERFFVQILFTLFNNQDLVDRICLPITQQLKLANILMC